MKNLLGEFLGTMGLLVVVVGSGIMGETLAGGNLAIALLANSLATGAGLYVLIQTFGTISPAHFNPAVSLMAWLRREISTQQFFAFSLVQIIGGILGVWLTHFMFSQPLLQISQHHRETFNLLVSEFVATSGLVVTISLTSKKSSSLTPMAVALYITSAYWFTSSTSFANPAVTMARSLTDTFAGIHPSGILGFALAQFLAAAIATKVSDALTRA